jgi:tetrahydromethanopterin S-methyltransferase subunit D
VNIARGVSHLFNKTIFISIGVHFIAVGGFSFTISGYFDIIVGLVISKAQSICRHLTGLLTAKYYAMLKPKMRPLNLNNFLKCQMVEWFGTASLKLKSMKQ